MLVFIRSHRGTFVADIVPNSGFADTDPRSLAAQALAIEVTRDLIKGGEILEGAWVNELHRSYGDAARLRSYTSALAKEAGQELFQWDRVYSLGTDGLGAE